MRNRSDHKKFIADFVENLSGEKLDAADFDQLSESLKEIYKLIEDYETLSSEHENLRNDYIKRISGMAKAVAAASRRRDEMEEQLGFIESLNNMPTEMLLKAYRKIQAKFQDSFPASFGLLSNKYHSLNKNSINDYK